MPAGIKIRFADSAVQDLEEILAYYAGQGAADTGKRLVASIVSAVESLADQPDMGRMVPEFDSEHLRELIRPPFRIVYRRDRRHVRIVRVWRSERLLRLPEP